MLNLSKFVGGITMNKNIISKQKRHLDNLQKVNPQLYQTIKTKLGIKHQPYTRLKAHLLIIKMVQALSTG